MADSKPTVADTTEAQIAVHWKEEEYYKPPTSFVAQANLTDPSVNERFSEKHFPECFDEYAEMLTWYERWRHDARHERPAVLEVVRRRQDQRELQLHRSPPGQVPEQGGAHFGAGAGRRRSR